MLFKESQVSLRTCVLLAETSESRAGFKLRVYFPIAVSVLLALAFDLRKDVIFPRSPDLHNFIGSHCWSQHSC